MPAETLSAETLKAIIEPVAYSVPNFRDGNVNNAVDQILSLLSSASVSGVGGDSARAVQDLAVSDQLYELVEALVEAEAGFELTGFDVPVPEGHAAPSGTMALQHIRKVLAKYPDLVNRVWDSVKSPCEGCGKPADYTDDDGVGTCADCAGEA